jgi:hypothetical protein
VALDPHAYKALQNYVARVSATRAVHRETVRDAIVLTLEQQAAISAKLSILWGRPYRCPLLLPIKPEHGYRSRVLKDAFTGDQYLEWLVAGCSDTAVVEDDEKGRPRLVLHDVLDHRNVRYDIVVPIRSDSAGFVHVDDVIPKGIF